MEETKLHENNNSHLKQNKMEECGLVMKDIKPSNIHVKRLHKNESAIPAVDEIDELDCDIETKHIEAEKEKLFEHTHQRLLPSPAESFRKLSRMGHHTDLPAQSFNSIVSHQSSPNFRRNNSVRSLKNYHHLLSEFNQNKLLSSDSGCQNCKPLDGSLRSWASVGMGSTDGKKMIVRRVPTSPVELFNIVNPPTPPEEYAFDEDTDDDTVEDEANEYIKPRRQHWSNKLQFVLACVGYSVGLGSIWRFPYLCYKSGGAVFLIPYAIIMVFIGGPMLYMELAVGQFTGRGPIGALGHLCPLFKGSGLGSVVMSFLVSTYYSVILAYGVYYFFTSFRVKLPWDDCSHPWNTHHCWTPSHLHLNQTKPKYTQSPAEEFYDRKVLQIGRGIEDFDIMRWELFSCLIFAWVLVYFGIWKSIKSSAKVRYFTATFPFVIIIILLIKSLTLDGSDMGMRYFFKPRFELLLEAKVWVSAACQTFNSMGGAFGSMICFASYNKYNNNILQDTIAVWLVNGFTSLLVGIFAFATIGNIATEQGTSIEDVLDDGPGLIFVVYPQAMAKMPASQIWAVFFFFMLICVVLNTQFAIVEVVVTSIQDGFPGWIKKHLMCHEVLVLIICVVSFGCGIPNVTQGGIYFFQLIDHYAATISTMYLAFFEVIAITWFYGAWRLSKNVKTMTGRHPGFFIKFCWLIVTPLMIFALWVFLIIDYEPPTYNNGVYHYPAWAIGIGWIISALSIICVPLHMAVELVKAEGSTFMQKFRNATKSDLLEKCPKCNELDCDCIIQEDDVGPMIVMPALDRKDQVGQSIANMPIYSVPGSMSPLADGNNTTNATASPTETLSQYDNLNEIRTTNEDHKN